MTTAIDSKVSLGDISVNFLQQMSLTSSKLGYDINPTLAKYNVSVAQLSAHHGRLSIPKYMRIGFELIQQTGRDDLGLLMGENVCFQHYGMLGFTCMSAIDISTMAYAIAQYESLLSQNVRGHSQFITDPQPTLRFYSIAPYNAYNYFVVDSVLASWFTLLTSRAVHLQTIKKDLKTSPHSNQSPHIIKAVHIEYPEPKNVERYQQFFNCPVIFNSTFNGLVLNSDYIEQPLPDACMSSYIQAQQLCQNELQRLQQNQDWQSKVIEKVSHHLVGSMPDINQVAALLGTSAWTLRRRLYKENTNYQCIMDKTRKGLALSYVRDTQLAFSEVSYLLGFATPAAFYKAFRRWTNSTPKNYRQAFISKRE
ncbi:AraC family transcriptional regulator [Moritella sp. 24]|uniref:AraC family transcriptional regulator n=1 Tax=Moritella sp. 24 TaxID=2746230 RepID=UPI001BA4AA07|nr:AraC family transcriptional regulator [Moritella sp. 24]QUM75396.1 AraC family transcriptional regulator [Moritella sp. 24]